MIDSTVVTNAGTFFAFVHVFDGDTDQNGKYSATALIPNTEENMKPLRAAVKNAVARGQREYWGRNVPRDLRYPIRDGNEIAGKRPEFTGYMYINARSLEPVPVCNGQLKPILSPDDFYSGCYGRAQITFFPYSNRGQNGVGAVLDSVQVLERGISYAGKGTFHSVFGPPVADPNDPNYQIPFHLEAVPSRRTQTG